MCRLGLVLALVGWLGGAPAPADDERVDWSQDLSLEQVLALARERAPALRAARTDVAVAEGQALDASLRLRDHPSLTFGSGQRSAGTQDFTDFELSLNQGLPRPGERAARLASAAAAVALARAANERSTAEVLRAVASAFFAVLHAEEVLLLAAAEDDVTAQLLQLVERRFAAGDVAVLELNLARVVHSRQRSQLATAKAEREASWGELRRLLGMRADETTTLRGDLREHFDFNREALLAQVSERPDLVAKEAELRAAEAELHLVELERRPSWAAGLTLAREGDEDVALATLSFSLPLFARAQGARAAAQARTEGLRQELMALRQAASDAVEVALAVYLARRAAALELEREILPLLAENATLARRSYEVGELSFSELLLVERENLSSRQDYYDRLLAAANAGFEVWASAGAIP